MLENDATCSLGIERALQAGARGSEFQDRMPSLAGRGIEEAAVPYRTAHSRLQIDFTADTGFSLLLPF